MKASFDLLPDNAKVWVYQSNIAFDDAQLSLIEELSEVFLSEWESHGIPVQGSVDVIDGMFIRIAAFTDEDSMCGRAQDAQVRLAKEFEAELNVELTNRMLLVFNIDGDLKVIHLNEIEKSIDSNLVNSNTPFYNNLVHSKKEFVSDWKMNAGDSWLERYFN